MILMGRARLLSRPQPFSVNIRSGYDAVQPSGQKIESGEKRTLTESRPDRMRAEVQHSDGDKNLVLFDHRGGDHEGQSPNSHALLGRLS